MFRLRANTSFEETSPPNFSDPVSLKEPPLVDISCDSPVLSETTVRLCPPTSRSEEGPSRERFAFNSQLSDGEEIISIDFFY